MRTRTRLMTALATVVMLTGLGLAPRPAAASIPVPSLLGTSRFVALQGSVLPGLNAARRMAELTAGRRMGVTVGLQLRNDTGLNAYLRQISTPGSAQYRHFLTTKQFAARFGPAAAQASAVTSWLRGSGLSDVQVSRNGFIVTAEGTAGAMDRAFGTTLYTFRQGKHDFYANATPVRIPAAVSGLVESVSGLTNRDSVSHPAFHMHVRTPDDVGSGPSGGLTPSDIAQTYDVQSMWDASYSGSGVTVALPGAGCSAQNIQTFDNYFHLPFNVGLVQVKDANGNKSATSSDESECEMDVETIQSVAPNAHVLIYSDTNPSLTALINMFDAMVSDNKASVISTSISAPETDYSNGQLSTFNSILREAAAQGQTVFTSTGDYGAFSAAADGASYANKLSVRFPGSDPWVTSVGGTSLSRNDDGSYAGETVWADGSDPNHPVGGGGGISKIFYRPWWQEGPGVSNSYSNGYREMPDVSADADPSSGYTMYTVDDKGHSTWGYVGGGTSASTPLWAGYGAILTQYLNGRVGFLNPTLYALGQRASSFQFAPFHDVTQGSNLYYPATAGYDLASGWGSFDGTALANAISTIGGLLPQVVIEGGIVEHTVKGKWKSTSALKLKETGLFEIAYNALHAGSLPVSATATAYRNNKAVQSWKMNPITFSDGVHGFSLKVHWDKAASKGTWIMGFKVSAGDYSDTYSVQFQVK